MSVNNFELDLDKIKNEGGFVNLEIPDSEYFLKARIQRRLTGLYIVSIRMFQAGSIVQSAETAAVISSRKLRIKILKKA
ncbi:MAG: hypothetical protein ABI462_11180 [Ignavibacteria bacterium]